MLYFDCFLLQQIVQCTLVNKTSWHQPYPSVKSNIILCALYYRLSLYDANLFAPLLFTMGLRDAMYDNSTADKTNSSATAKSTARPSCLVGALYDISWEKIC